MTTKTRKRAGTDTYTTILGETIAYPRPTKAVAAFLRRVMKAANDPEVSEPAFTDLVYGKDNPVLDQSFFPGRGAVTKAVLADPVYHVMLDLICAKQIANGGLDADQVAESFSMTVTEAAKELGIHPASVRTAVKNKKIAARKTGSQYYLDPRSVRAYRVSNRGPKRKSSDRS